MLFCLTVQHGTEAGSVAFFFPFLCEFQRKVWLRSRESGGLVIADISRALRISFVEFTKVSMRWGYRKSVGAAGANRNYSSLQGRQTR